MTTEYKRKGKNYLNMDKFISRAEAVDNLCKLWRPEPEGKNLPLSEAVGCVCAEKLFSQNTLPVERESAADGIAVRFADFENGLPDTSAWVEGVNFVPADMGDDFDNKFDTIINIECVSFDADQRIKITLDKELTQGNMVKQCGSTLKKGEALLQPGLVINPFQAGLLGSAGINSLKVVPRPKVAYIPTGNELVPLGTSPGRGQHVETNSLMIKEMLSRWQADCLIFPIIKDSKAELEAALNKALQEADIVLINGGSSMGSEDFVSGLLPKRASYMQHGILCIPGMPAAVAIIDDKPVINMPGPPFGAFCAMDWSVKNLISHWYKRPPMKRRSVAVRLGSAINKPQKFDMYIRLQLMHDLSGAVLAVPISMHDRYADAAEKFEALFVAPMGVEAFKSGEEIIAELLFTENL